MRLEYITGAVRVPPFNPISASVPNHSAMKEVVRIRIYQSVAIGAELLVDTGDIEVIAMGDPRRCNTSAVRSGLLGSD